MTIEANNWVLILVVVDRVLGGILIMTIRLWKSTVLILVVVDRVLGVIRPTPLLFAAVTS